MPVEQTKGRKEVSTKSGEYSKNRSKCKTSKSDTMFFCFTFFKDCGKFELKSFLTILFVNNAVDFSTSNRAMIIKRK